MSSYPTDPRNPRQNPPRQGPVQPGPQRPLPPPRASRSQNRRMLPWLVLGGTVVISVMVMLAVVGGIGLVYLSQDRIPDDVSVTGIAIGGKTVEDATDILSKTLPVPSVTATDGDRRWTLSLSDLGAWIDIDATIERAMAAEPGLDIPLFYGIDLSRAQDGLINLAAQVNIPAVPGRDAQMGRAIEIPVVLDRLRADATYELSDGLLPLAMIEVEPPEIESAETYTGARTTHVVEPLQELGLIARMYGVSMNDIVALNDIADPDLIYPGQELVIPAAGEYTPTQEEAPPAPRSTGRSILVDTGAQRIYAYENGLLVRSHLVSTGRSQTPTVLGDYEIYVKLRADDMSGPDYFLPDVPYTMYFYQGYAIHGTYWHNSFGRPMSHGCVNLPTAEAEWFFNFASVGTLVRVI